MAWCVLAGTHLRAGTSFDVRPVELFTNAFDLHGDLRQWTPVSRLERRLPCLFAQPLGAAPVVRCCARSLARFAAVGAGTGPRCHRRYDSEEAQPPHSGRQGAARSNVTALPRKFLLWSALRASFGISQPPER